MKAPHNLQNSGNNSLFVWFFGYVGASFFPQTELGVSQTEMVSVAQEIKNGVGNSTEVHLVSAVDQTPGRGIQWSRNSTISQISSYVTSLRKYATYVYGRIDLYEFNLTTKQSVYSEVSNYAHFLDLNGIWFDHAAEYYGRVGQGSFNSMMQNLTSALPEMRFILNHSERRTGIITPLAGTSWENSTFVTPTIFCGSKTNSCGVGLSVLGLLNHLFPSHVIEHFDSFAKNPNSPMGIFANYSSSREAHVLDSIAYAGTHPSGGNPLYFYHVLYPIIGGWTYIGGPYKGTIYNSFRRKLQQVNIWKFYANNFE